MTAIVYDRENKEALHNNVNEDAVHYGVVRCRSLSFEDRLSSRSLVTNAHGGLHSNKE
jgi:hypothetical protein